MFDDQPTKGPTPPGNLPIGEPDDIFRGVEKTDESLETAPIIDQPSALERGVLRPKQEIPTERPDVYMVKEPVLARGIVTFLVIIVILGVLGGGGWWVYNRFVKQGGNTAVDTTQLTGDKVIVDIVPEDLPPVVETPIESGTTQDVGAEVKDQEALFGEPIDKDGDGLDDTKEVELGTDPNNWDSDGDELSDGDEVLVWKTNPLNPDTDGDKFPDGTEVKGGYNPNGTGKIFEPPKS